MDPKEKAKQLIWEFLPLLEGWESKEKTELSKKLALICVNEVQQTNPTIKGNSDDLTTMIVQTKAYWRMVEAEIKNF
ncbi:hypothetical protein HCG49_17025 [Arenibacter sp. 6A1]|uniref:hypothetical protein n=1 Tax=Arenibacter sp. 6A1 TaxID=2720391 RepID=UPI0014480730|nr:hypothetical protein [Arenibacter sp. 6A1]NKI28259.1 hypothetical protein [Arenibacter sp. 6A1]